MKYMMYLLIIALFAAISMIAIAYVIQLTRKSNSSTSEYKKKYLLTKNEYSFFQKLKPIAKSNELNVLCKIRLADLIEPVKKGDKKEWYSAFNKIKSKHIDFALVTENMQVELLIELMDNSHSKSNRAERDVFVNSALEQAGYTVVNVWNNNEAAGIIEAALHKEEEISAETAEEENKEKCHSISENGKTVD